jgi:hypothetical protein
VDIDGAKPIQELQEQLLAMLAANNIEAAGSALSV